MRTREEPSAPATVRAISALRPLEAQCRATARTVRTQMGSVRAPRRGHGARLRAGPSDPGHVALRRNAGARVPCATCKRCDGRIRRNIAPRFAHAPRWSLKQACRAWEAPHRCAPQLRRPRTGASTPPAPPAAPPLHTAPQCNGADARARARPCVRSRLPRSDLGHSHLFASPARGARTPGSRTGQSPGASSRIAPPDTPLSMSGAMEEEGGETGDEVKHCAWRAPQGNAGTHKRG